MLSDFLTEQRAPILAMAKEKALEMQGVRTSQPIEEGWNLFFDELIGLLKRDQPFEVRSEIGLHSVAASNQGREYLRLGYSVSEVVHSYGILCQSITAVATEQQFKLTSREFQRLNLSLDTAIAEAVSEFDRMRSKSFDNEEARRLGFLAHELRTCLQSATISLEMIESGSVGVRSSTGNVLDTSLTRMTSLIDTTLTELRLQLEPRCILERTRVFDLLGEVGVTSGFDARARRMTLLVRGLPEIEVSVDRQLFVAALANIVQNSIGISNAGSTITIRAHEVSDRVLIEIEDECSDNEKHIDEMRVGFGMHDGQTSTDPNSPLSISKQAIERNGGTIRVENVDGRGCIVVIDLPKPLASVETSKSPEPLNDRNGS